MCRGTEREREMLHIYCVCIWMHMYMHIQAERSATLYTRAIRVTAGVLHSVSKTNNRPSSIQIHEPRTTTPHFCVGCDGHTD
jgi:hypothetical protein